MYQISTINLHIIAGAHCLRFQVDIEFRGREGVVCVNYIYLK